MAARFRGRPLVCPAELPDGPPASAGVLGKIGFILDMFAAQHGPSGTRVPWGMTRMQSEQWRLGVGLFPMETASDYRDFAAECRRLAQRAKTEHQREILLEMAQAWLGLAEEAGRKPGRPKQ
jgi:hypothetical protein